MMYIPADKNSFLILISRIIGDIFISDMNMLEVA